MSEDKTVVTGNENNAKEKKAKAKDSHKVSIGWIIGVAVLVLLSLVMILPTTCLADTSSNLVSFGTYNGKKIELTNNSFLYFQYIQLYNYYAQNYGESTAQSYDFYIWNSAFQQAVVNEAFQEMADKAGFRATKAQIADAIVNSGIYTDAESYSNTTDQQKEQITAWMTEYVPYQEVYSTINSIPTSTAESAFIGTLNSEKRSLEYFVLDSSLYPDEDAVSYAKERADLFRTISFTRATYPTEEEARNALSAIKSGEKTMDEAVSESIDSYKDNGGKVESLFRYQLESDLASEDASRAEEIYAAEEKTVVGPVKTAEGYTLFSIDSASSDPDYTDENVIDSIKDYISANDNDCIKAYLDTIKDDIYSSAQADFEKEAEKLGLEIATVSDVALNTGATDYIYSFNYDTTGYFSSQDASWAEKVFQTDYNTVLEPFYASSAYVIARPVESKGASSASYMTSYFTSYYSYYAPTYTVSDFGSELFISEKAVNDVSNGYITLLMNNMSASSN